ncbi:unnamed protein product [Cercospora beticola]|nr:unnamed protein product [Cercospora beticola]
MQWISRCLPVASTRQAPWHQPAVTSSRYCDIAAAINQYTDTNYTEQAPTTSSTPRRRSSLAICRQKAPSPPKPKGSSAMTRLCCAACSKSPIVLLADTTGADHPSTVYVRRSWHWPMTELGPSLHEPQSFSTDVHCTIAAAALGENDVDLLV